MYAKFYLDNNFIRSMEFCYAFSGITQAVTHKGGRRSRNTDHEFHIFQQSNNFDYVYLYVYSTPEFSMESKSGGKYRIVKFDGKTYPSNPSMQPELKLLPGDGLPRALDFVNEPYPWFKF